MIGNNEQNGLMFDDALKELAVSESVKVEQEKEENLNYELLEGMISILIALKKGMKNGNRLRVD